MLKLDPISDNALTIYDKVARRKHKKTRDGLKLIRPCIEQAYREYDRRKPDLENIPKDRFQGVVKELNDCYTIETDERDRVCAKVKSLAESCPYCACGVVSTLDHYLPKKSYPEFSILPANLVPACSDCNTPRSFTDQTGKRSLVHPYFDPIPNDTPLLTADVTVSNNLPQASFSVDTISGSIFSLLYERHFKLLNLGERYARRAELKVLPEIVRVVRRWSVNPPIPPMTKAQVKVKLSEWAQDEAEALGANHYKAALLRGAAISPAFITYL